MAAEASKRSGGAAGGGASAESLFNQGVVLWNGQKDAEAKVQFEAAVKAKPDYADAHYWSGWRAQHRRDAGRPRVVRELPGARAHRASTPSR